MVNPIAPNAKRDIKSNPTEWVGLDASSFDGSGFEALETRAKTARKWGERRNKFIVGASKFISYTIRFDRQQAAVERPEVTKKDPINKKARLTKSQRLGLTEAVQKQIREASIFMWQEIMPLTLAWSTAIQDTEERLSQIVGPEKLPTPYIVNRVNEAAHLKINRYISKQFELTPDEAKVLMMALTAKYTTRDE